MLYVIIILSVFCVGFFFWKSRCDKKHKDTACCNKNLKNFRSEEDLPEYGKPLNDGKATPEVDFEDAE